MTSSQAAAALARTGGDEAFRERQRARIQAYWDSPRSRRHKRQMSERPIRLGKTRK